MSTEPRDAYEILGVEPSATEEQIRRVYRHRLISSHREGVFAMVDKIREIRGAFAELRDPERRQVYDLHRRQALVQMAQGATSFDRQVAREGKERVKMGRSLRKIAQKRGAEAREENADTVRWLGREHEERERVEALHRARRALAQRIFRGTLTVAVLAGLFFMALRWSERRGPSALAETGDRSKLGSKRFFYHEPACDQIGGSLARMP